MYSVPKLLANQSIHERTSSIHNIQICTMETIAAVVYRGKERLSWNSQYNSLSLLQTVGCNYDALLLLLTSCHTMLPNSHYLLSEHMWEPHADTVSCRLGDWKSQTAKFKPILDFEICVHGFPWWQSKLACLLPLSTVYWMAPFPRKKAHKWLKSFWEHGQWQ